jgi:hypothetical protein
MAARFSGSYSSGMQKSENPVGPRRFVKSNRYRARPKLAFSSRRPRQTLAWNTPAEKMLELQQATA